MRITRVLTLAILLHAGAAFAQAGPPAAGSPLDPALETVLRTGCLEGVPALAAAAAGPGVSAEDGATARRILGLCQKVAADPRSAGRLRLHDPDAGPDRSGRGKLVFVSTGYGIWMGIAVDIYADIEGRAAVIAPVIGGAAGVSLSLFLTQDGEMTNGQAWTIITGLDYGTYSGLLWGLAIDDEKEKVYVGASMVTGLVGGTLATIVAQRYRPSQGDAELVRSGGLWGFATGALLAAVAQPDDNRATFAMMGAGMDGGLLAGALLAQVAEPSRNRMLLIDTAGLGGGLLGFAGAFLATGSLDSGNDARVVAGTTLGGLLVGLATGIYFTRDMLPDRQDALAPVPALVTRDVAGRFRVGRLSVLPVVTTTGLGGSRLTGAMAPLVGGVW